MSACVQESSASRACGCVEGTGDRAAGEGDLRAVLVQLEQIAFDRCIEVSELCERLFSRAREIIDCRDAELVGVVYRCARRIARGRAELGAWDYASGETNNRQQVLTMLFISEGHMRFCLCENLALLPRLSPSASCFDRAFHESIVGDYDPSALSAATARYLTALQRSPLPADAHAVLLYGVCVRAGGESASWRDVQAAEIITSHHWACLCVDDALVALGGESQGDSARDSDPVLAWHSKKMGHQHSDEFLVQITDDIIHMSLVEAEVLHPETLSVFSKTKPRSGYHWYTRLRAIRDADDGNALHKRANLRTLEMDADMRELTLISYVDYYMKHAGVEKWSETFVLSRSYPKRCLALLAERSVLREGEIKLPCFILRGASAHYLLDTCDGRLCVVAKHATMPDAVAGWCRRILEVNDGMIAPRVSCKKAAMEILGLREAVEEPIDFDADGEVESAEAEIARLCALEISSARRLGVSEE